MKATLQFVEAFIICLVIGVVVLLGAATLIHAVFDRKTEVRPDLTTPPAYIICQQDAVGNCRVKGH